MFQVSCTFLRNEGRENDFDSSTFNQHQLDLLIPREQSHNNNNALRDFTRSILGLRNSEKSQTKLLFLFDTFNHFSNIYFHSSSLNFMKLLGL